MPLGRDKESLTENNYNKLGKDDKVKTHTR